MKIAWEITTADVTKARAFFDTHKDSCMVQERAKRNLRQPKAEFSKADFWIRMIACLLTTQQRSGPHSAVNRFLSESPFALDYAICAARADLDDLVEVTLTRFGGIWRAKIISDEIKKNHSYLESGGWADVFNVTGTLRSSATVAEEREAAVFIDKNLAGFGPKQSRNLLQMLGLTKYETPIDSRIINWLNDFGFPIRLSPAPLGDADYYHFVEDGLQTLCAASGIYPCQMDAAVFASYDNGGWTEENSIW